MKKHQWDKVKDKDNTFICKQCGWKKARTSTFIRFKYYRGDESTIIYPECEKSKGKEIGMKTDTEKCTNAKCEYYDEKYPDNCGGELLGETAFATCNKKKICKKEIEEQNDKNRKVL